MFQKISSNNFFSENLVALISDRVNKENELISDFFVTRLTSNYLLVSTIVAKVVSINIFLEDRYLLKGDFLCQVNYLDELYSLVMEENGYVEKVYIKDNQVIDYYHPLFLIKLI